MNSKVTQKDLEAILAGQSPFLKNKPPIPLSDEELLALVDTDESREKTRNAKIITEDFVPPPHKSTTEVLSQAEVDQLLDAISCRDDESDNLRSEKENKKLRVKIVDFGNYLRYTQKNMRNLSSLHDDLVSHEMYASLKELYGFDNNSHMHLVSVDQMRFSNFLTSLPSPFFMGVVKFNKFSNPLIIEADSNIILPLMKKEIVSVMYPTLFEKDEQNFFSKGILLRVIDSLISQNNKVFKSPPKSVEIIDNFSSFNTDLFKKTGVLLTIELESPTDKVSGMINIWYFEEFVNEFIKAYESKEIKTIGDTEMEITYNKPFDEKGIKLEVLAELGRSKLTLDELRAVGEGSIIKLNTVMGEVIKLTIDGKLFAKGEVVAIGENENFGIRVIECITNGETN